MGIITFDTKNRNSRPCQSMHYYETQKNVNPRGQIFPQNPHMSSEDRIYANQNQQYQRGSSARPKENAYVIAEFDTKPQVNFHVQEYSELYIHLVYPNSEFHHRKRFNKLRCSPCMCQPMHFR
jgi:hypothetical protein